jgi:hypothetical protein
MTSISTPASAYALFFAAIRVSVFEGAQCSTAGGADNRKRAGSASVLTRRVPMVGKKGDNFSKV